MRRGLAMQIAVGSVSAGGCAGSFDGHEAGLTEREAAAQAVRGRAGMDERGRADRVHESGTLNEMPQSWETEAEMRREKRGTEYSRVPVTSGWGVGSWDGGRGRWRPVMI